MNNPFDKVDWKPIPHVDDEVLRGESIMTDTGDNRHERRIEITVVEDGAIFFSEDGAENFIYFYPNQLKHLRNALKVALRQERESRKRKDKK